MHHYVYKQTRDTGEYYFGIHSTDNLEDNYQGSGTKFKDKYKHNPDSFTKEIVLTEDSRALIEEFEELLVDEDMLKDVLCLNLITGGGLGLPSEETKTKMSNNHADFSGNKNGRADLNKYWFIHDTYGIVNCDRYYLQNNFNKPKRINHLFGKHKREASHGWSIYKGDLIQ